MMHPAAPLKALLEHSGVADAHEEDLEPEDRAAESTARRLLDTQSAKPS
jgi:hypothetical protein